MCRCPSEDVPIEHIHYSIFPADWACQKELEKNLFYNWGIKNMFRRIKNEHFFLYLSISVLYISIEGGFKWCFVSLLARSPNSFMDILGGVFCLGWFCVGLVLFFSKLFFIFWCKGRYIKIYKVYVFFTFPKCTHLLFSLANCCSLMDSLHF